MLDPSLGNPVRMIRMKNPDGTWFFTEEECLRRIEVILERAKQVWRAELILEHKKQKEKPA